MLAKIKNLSKSKNNKKLFSNFLSLTYLQSANYILPLVTFPYLVRVLGIDYFGILAFATVTISYLNIIVDYGFNLSATKSISSNRDNKDMVVEIFSSVITIKVLLVLLCFIFLSIIVFSFELFYDERVIYFLTFGTVIGQALFPVWFFQGIEEMKYITYINVLAKAIFAICIFIFVNEKNDYYLVPILTSLGYFFSGIISFSVIRKKFNIKFKLQSVAVIKKYFIDGWDVFVSRIFVSFYTTTNLFLLGILSNSTVVGSYSIAEKIVNAIGGLFAPANQALYPYMVRLYNERPSKFYSFTKNISVVFLLTSVVLFIISYLFGDQIVKLIAGYEDKDIESIFFILVFTVITAPFGAFFTQVLLIRKFNKGFNQVVRNTFLFNIILAPVMIFLYQGIGLSIVAVLSQFLVITLCLLKIKKGAYGEI